MRIDRSERCAIQQFTTAHTCTVHTSAVRSRSSQSHVVIHDVAVSIELEDTYSAAQRAGLGIGRVVIASIGTRKRFRSVRITVKRARRKAGTVSAAVKKLDRFSAVGDGSAIHTVAQLHSTAILAASVRTSGKKTSIKQEERMIEMVRQSNP